jgi:hypothetical protein
MILKITNLFKKYPRLLREDYGTVVKFPSLFGKPEMICSYNVDDAEKVKKFL